MKFAGVVGQEAAKAHIAALAGGGRLPHAMLLAGPQGSGKLALAMAVAEHLLSAADGASNAGAMLRELTHPDLHFAYPVVRPAGTSADHKMASSDFATQWRDTLARSRYFTMDQWLAAMGAANQQAQIGAGDSEELSRSLALKPAYGGHKVCIVWAAERMNTECANKLLKLLEEPPEKTTFILTTENPGAMLDTILSRTQRIRVPRIAAEDIAAELQRARGIGPEEARRIARTAQGSWTAALQTLGAGGEGADFLAMFQALTRAAYTKDVRKLKAWADSAAEMGRERQRRFIDYFARMVRENFAHNFRLPEITYMTREEEGFAANFARFVNEGNVKGLLAIADRAKRDIGQNANPKMVFFDTALAATVLIRRQ